MALTALSSENQINRILSELDCAASNFAAIAGVLSPSRVAAALAGTSDFSASDGVKHLDVAREMRLLQDEISAPLDWRKVERVREVLAARRQQQLMARPIPFSVILVGMRLFKRISSRRVETTASYEDCAAFKNPVVAGRAAKILDGMGESVQITTITNQIRSPEDISGELADFGFQA